MDLWGYIALEIFWFVDTISVNIRIAQGNIVVIKIIAIELRCRMVRSKRWRTEFRVVSFSVREGSSAMAFQRGDRC
jgi:hypothetical protein